MLRLGMLQVRTNSTERAFSPVDLAANAYTCGALRGALALNDSYDLGRDSSYGLAFQTVMDAVAAAL